jgi:hypothetical protein
MHLPLTHANHDLQNHELVSFVVALPGVSTIYSLDLGDAMLAVDWKGNWFALIMPETLAACFTVGHKYLSPGLTFFFRDLEPSCLCSPSSLGLLVGYVVHASPHTRLHGQVCHTAALSPTT